MDYVYIHSLIRERLHLYVLIFVWSTVKCLCTMFICSYKKNVFDLLLMFALICVSESMSIRAGTVYQYIDISQYWQSQYNMNTSYYSIDISKYWYIAIYRLILEGINVKAYLKSTTCLFAKSNDV